MIFSWIGKRDVKKEKISDMLYFQSEIIVNNCILNKGPNDSLFFGKDMPKFEIKYNINFRNESSDSYK